MGQQQLLLIILSVIIVGLAIIVGINIFYANAPESNRNSIYSELTNFGSQARKYYLETTSLGGGNQSFSGWTIPDNLTTTGSATYAVNVTPQLVTIIGTGTQTGNDGSTKVKVTNYVTFAKDSIVINN